MDDLQIARALRAAAGKLRRDGWIQGRAYAKTDGSGGTCIGAAILCVVGYRIDRMVGCADAMRFACRVGHEWGHIATWNDTPGRTLDEILDRLESTALALEIKALAADKPAEVAEESNELASAAAL